MVGNTKLSGRVHSSDDVADMHGPKEMISRLAGTSLVG